MASLGLSNTEIKANLAMVMGISRNEDLTDFGWDDQTIADVERIIRSGRRKFIAAYDWSFLTEEFVINVITPEESSTVTIVNGVVTRAAGTWNSLAAGQRLAVGGSVYHVSTRDSNTQLTLFDTSVNEAAGTAYKLYFTRYALPAAFAAFISPVRIENSRDGVDLREMAVLPDYSVQSFLSRQAAISRRPEAFCVSSVMTNNETGMPTYFLELYPLPDQAYVVKTDIRLNPGDSLSETGEIFHASFSELMQEAILAAGEAMYNGDPQGPHNKEFERMLPDYIRKDKVAAGVRRLPARTDGIRRNFPRNYELIVGEVDVDAGV